MLNQKELELIRKEMINLKDCITKYIGYVFAGSGATVYGIARMSSASQSISPGMSFVSFMISIIISFVAIIVFYKFHSHNRFAGYCKLLSHEKYSFPNNEEIKLSFSWELAVGRLRCFDFAPEKMGQLIEEIDVKNIKKDILKKKTIELIDCRDEKGKINSGLKILANALLGKVVTKSWAFPPFITAILFILSIGFFAAGWFITFQLTNLHIVLIIVAIFTTVFQIALWMRMIKKLHDFMNGFLTVESFFLKFLPIRSSFLNSYGITPEYLDTDKIISGIDC